MGSTPSVYKLSNLSIDYEMGCRLSYQTEALSVTVDSLAYDCRQSSLVLES